MENTGERYLPSCHPADMSCEHWHRYLYARQFVQNKDVLDVACGEGYGSFLLSETAHRVVGLDISTDAIDHASAAYVQPNLEFKAGDAARIPISGTAHFDLIVSFETIEHLTAECQAAFLGEVVRLLKRGGQFIVSTPNKSQYSDLSGYRNEFHLKEFQVEEFREFLGKYFGAVKLLGQRVYLASYIWDPEGDYKKELREYRLQWSQAGYYPSDEPKQMRYTIAICSQTKRDGANPSLLVDLSDGTGIGDRDQGPALAWQQDRAKGTEEMRAVIPPGKSFILIDEDQWGIKELGGERRGIPFLEHNGQYWGVPPDDETAVRECERLRQEGASLLVIARPAFWWLDYYSEWRQHLIATCRCLRANEQVCVFDLLQPPPPGSTGGELDHVLAAARGRRQAKAGGYPPGDLRACERRVSSEGGEDGILEEILHRVGPGTKFFVEFGVGSGRYCNCARLVVEEDWHGLFMEVAPESFYRLEQRYRAYPKVRCTQALVTSANIETLLATYNVPRDFDVLSIDIDGNDYYVWAAIKQWHPRVVVIEYNSSFPPPQKWVMNEDPKRQWDGTGDFGASLAALAALGKEKGYALVATDSEGVNAFFVKAELVTEEQFLDAAVYYHYGPPRWGPQQDNARQG
jgi:SAM-dependent methyltransferase